MGVDFKNRPAFSKLEVVSWKCPLVFASGCGVVGRYVCVSGLSLHYAMRVDMQNIPLKIL